MPHSPIAHHTYCSPIVIFPIIPNPLFSSFFSPSPCPMFSFGFRRTRRFLYFALREFTFHFPLFPLVANLVFFCFFIVVVDPFCEVCLRRIFLPSLYLVHLLFFFPSHTVWQLSPIGPFIPPLSSLFPVGTPLRVLVQCSKMRVTEPTMIYGLCFIFPCACRSLVSLRFSHYPFPPQKTI